MSLMAALSLCAAVVSAGTAGFVLLREKRSLVRWSLVVGLLLLGLESLCSGLSLITVSAERMLMWQKGRLLALALAPTAWLVFSLSYARGAYETFVRAWRSTILLALLLPVSMIAVFWDSLFTSIQHAEETASLFIGHNLPANVIHALFILIGVLAIMNLERTLRAATGTMRWRIKFMVVGVVMLLAIKIYISTQALLYSSLDLSLDGLNAAGLLICEALMLRSLLRAHLLKVDLYPSQHILYRSFTALLAGLYLLAVGLMAQLATQLGFAQGFPLKAFLLFAAIVGLSVLAISDRVRQTTRRFVARQFGRPMYDCRKVWTEFTQRTSSAASTPPLCQAVARMVSDTFEVLSVTLWLVDESQRKLLFGASTSLAPAEAGMLIKEHESDEEIIRALQAADRPLDLERVKGTWVHPFKRSNPLRFPNRGIQRLCVPLGTGDRLLGLMVLADRVRGVSYSTEEMDLLQTIGEQVGAKLLNLRLAARLLEAKQMEAFQAMSAFFVHDLKNTSSTLSLMLQNLPRHFGDPTFRDDALTAISRSVNKINELIRRLTTLRQKMDIRTKPTDLNRLVRETLEQVPGKDNQPIEPWLATIPTLTIDPDQIQKVLTNLVLNARDATAKKGGISVKTLRHKEWAIVEVRDTGCGMSRDFLTQSLFRPFKSTKQTGMGIGLFQSKMIVEAHHGRLEAESQAGEGSTFRLWLPIEAKERHESEAIDRGR